MVLLIYVEVIIKVGGTTRGNLKAKDMAEAFDRGEHKDLAERLHMGDSRVLHNGSMGTQWPHSSSNQSYYSPQS